MQRALGLALIVTGALWAAMPRRAGAEDELVAAFAFGSRQLTCATASEPGTNYTMVFHGSAAELEYNAGRGWGYEVTYPANSGYFVFGPFDDSPNSRTQFPDTCPHELYDSFIGGKGWDSFCDAVEPCGLVFRVDVPNGQYRFVAAVGSADNEHTHRIVVEDGGSGPPASMSNRTAVLVDNFDQAAEGVGVFAAVGFDGRVPPPAAVNGFVNMDQSGLPTLGDPSSPMLEVTTGTIRLHQLRGTSVGADGNGGDMVVFEIWRVDSGFDVVGRGANWKYFRGQQEASSPDTTAWRTVGFNDSSWATGAAPFGYGDPPLSTDLSTLVPPMEDNYSTLYLRRTFQLADASAIDQLRANIDYDDAFVFWINGVEVLRANVDDPLSFDSLASVGHESGIYEGFDLLPPFDYLVSGTNVVAVQVFNTTLSSSDLKFDMDLGDPVAPDISPPEISARVPAAGARVRSLVQIQISFTEAVTGVDAADLLVNGVAALSVSGSGAGPYTFAAPVVGDGPVNVAWRAGHGIADTSEFSNPFAGGAWSYTVDSTAPIGNIVINEFLASNDSGLTDEDGEPSDWIEFYNAGSEVVSLNGWSVTDDFDDSGLWTFPDISLGPFEYLVVFASGKDRSPTNGGPLHTSFRLNLTGEGLALYNEESPRQLIMGFQPRYPRQQSDISYGLDSGGNFAYFQTPTPGAPNSDATSLDGFVVAPEALPGRGFYTTATDVVLSTITPGATIRYTLDGSKPSTTRGTVYSSPIRVAGAANRGVVTIRAIAYRSGFLPSEVTTHSYLFLDDVLTQPNNPPGFPSSWNAQSADYEMDPTVVNDAAHRNFVRQGLETIPTLSIVTNVADLFDSSTGIYANPSREGVQWEREVSAEMIYPDGRRGFQEDCGLRIQGGSSTGGWKAIKVSMRLLFKGDYGAEKLNFPLFEDSPVEEFNTLVLDAHLNQTWNHPDHGQRVRAQYCRDQFCSDLQNAMGGYGPHDIFINLYLNGLYWGVYDLHERPDAAFASSYFGGDRDQYDAIRHSSGNVVDGTSAAWNTTLSLSRQDLSSNSNYQALRDYLDIPGLADYMLVNIFAGNDDWPHHNWYATRLRAPGAPYRIHSWDAEHVIKSTTINRTGVNNGSTPAELYTNLRNNAEFRLLFADRVHRHFFNGGPLYVDPNNRTWDPDNPQRNRPAALWMRRIDEIDPSIACESARWGDAKRPGDPYTRNDEWQTELNWILNYFRNRSETVLGQLQSANLYPTVGAPVFSRHGGRVQPGFVLSMTRPAGTSGTMYYTLDGTDPRVPVTGAVSPRATAYSSAVTLNDHTVVKARTLNGTTWSALTEATFSLADPATVRITEIMYNPPEGNALEFIELRNTGALTVDLTGVQFTNGIDFTFPSGASLGPGEYLVLVSSIVDFDSVYPGAPVEGIYNGQLSNGGEKVTLKDAGGRTIVSVDYRDDEFWPIAPDGFGYSLVLVDPEGDFDDPSTWRASSAVRGSPGATDPAPQHGGVFVNEVLARGVAPFEDAIEVFNRTAAPMDIGGWYLSNSRDTIASLQTFRIPDGTIVPAGGYHAFYEAEFGMVAGGAGVRFDLDERGGAVYLTAATAGGAITGFITGVEYGPDDQGVSFGRVETSGGPVSTALESVSFGVSFPASVAEFRTGTGAPNDTPLFGPVVINEIMYNPADGQEEFIELYNPSGAALSLFDSTLGRGWRVSGVQNAFESDTYEFGPGDAVPAGGYLLVVGIDPAVFRAINVVPGAAPIAAPFGGGIDNSGERLRLLRPIEIVAGEVSYVVVDEVRYNDAPPWPISADGGGVSLERITAAVHGDEAANWDASTRTGGTPGSENTATNPGANLVPRAAIVATPSSGVAPLDVLFDATQSFDLDGSIVSYDWDFDDGTTATEPIVSHTFNAPGSYLVVLTVEDDDGETDTATRVITVEVDLGGGQIIGDGNQDRVLDISDAVSLLRRLFAASPGPLPCEGATVNDGGNRVLLDSNDDGSVDVADVIYNLNYLFKNGPAPVSGDSCLPIVGCPDVCAF